jgi:two-component system NtrC family sensor kinase
MRAEVEPGLSFRGDPGQLQQVLINLLLNAVQATHPGGEVRVTLRRRNAQIELQVEDQGSGIAEENLGKVLDPFFTTKATGEGSGLGLSISLGIVQQHGGQLRLANGPDGGAVARVCLPDTVEPEGT